MKSLTKNTNNCQSSYHIGRRYYSAVVLAFCAVTVALTSFSGRADIIPYVGDSVWYPAQGMPNYQQWIADGIEDDGRQASFAAILLGTNTKLGHRPIFVPPITPGTMGYAIIPLTSFDRFSPGRNFLGTNIHTGDFNLSPNTALEFSVVMRFPDPTARLVGAFFVQEGPPNNEIDFECPWQLLKDNYLWLNSWNTGSYLGGRNPLQDVSALPISKAGKWTGWNNWHTYTFRWGHTSVTWGIDGKRVRQIPRPGLPTRIPDVNKHVSIFCEVWLAPHDWDMGEYYNRKATTDRYQASTVENPRTDPIIPFPGNTTMRGHYFLVREVRVERVNDVKVRAKSRSRRHR